MEWTIKQDPGICCIQDTYFNGTHSPTQECMEANQTGITIQKSNKANEIKRNHERMFQKTNRAPKF